MTSILTNIAAMSAAQKLRDVNAGLEITQDRVSSGLRVADSSHNAAYWSIAKTMKSDHNALSAVSDAIGLGSAKVDIAKAGMGKAIEVMSNIKSKLVAALEPGTDADSIQEEISQLQQQLRGIAEGASFNGENWLQANIGSPSGFVMKSVISSFIREHTGEVRVTNIEYKLDSNSVLFDTSQKSGKSYGILDKELIVKPKTPQLSTVAVSYVDAKGNKVSRSHSVATADGAWLKGMKATFDQENGLATLVDNTTIYLRVGEDRWVRATEDRRPFDGTGDLPKALGQKENKSYYMDTTATTVDATAIADEVNVGYSVTSFNITHHANGDMYNETASIQKILSFIDKQVKSVISAAGKLGSISSRISIQEDFVQFMRDAIERGIGRLVDADMAAESSKLSALQTQQQLAIQALSIVNHSQQGTLSLFRG
ncbi:MAG: flagellin [Candidatus Liberibacter ctenarytainae]|uniref:Flagellin n=1 Tax=Candidatus Liberibacter ctenarytainae TaxID=2020335 RepID=A0A937APE0_9HYPH|nr:flagellin [Candidatus Liberibacter ctenarytainae]